MTPKQAQYLVPIHPIFFISRHRPRHIFEKLKTMFINGLDQTSEEHYWFPTPETCSDASNLKGIEKTIYEQLAKCKKEENLNPKRDEQSKTEFLSKLSFEKSILTTLEIDDVQNY